MEMKLDFFYRTSSDLPHARVKNFPRIRSNASIFNESVVSENENIIFKSISN
jgi:hypothetical protein